VLSAPERRLVEAAKDFQEITRQELAEKSLRVEFFALRLFQKAAPNHADTRILGGAEGKPYFSYRQ
jgi:hypothetical protein